MIRFSQIVFFAAGILGVLILAPQYLLESTVGRDYPPPITHPEYFYGFVGVALAFQFVFLAIAIDPVRYRLMMIPSVLEKLSFGIPVLILFFIGRAPAVLVGFGLFDLLLGSLFLFCFVKLGNDAYRS